MWGGLIGLIIQLITGAVGGNIAGAAMKRYDVGTIGNSIAGLIGGGVGAQIIGALLGGGGEGVTAGAGGLDIGSIIGQIASGGVGGGILMVIVGLIKQAMGIKPPDQHRTPSSAIYDASIGLIAVRRVVSILQMGKGGSA